MSNEERAQRVLALLDERTKAKQDEALLASSLVAASERFSRISTAFRGITDSDRARRDKAQIDLDQLFASGDFTAMRVDVNAYLEALGIIRRTEEALRLAGVQLH